MVERSIWSREASGSAAPSLARIEQVLIELVRFVATPGDRDQQEQTLPSEEIRAAAVLMQAGRRLDSAVAWIRALRARDQALGADLFSDPA